MLPIRNISYLLPMCCSFWLKNAKTVQSVSLQLTQLGILVHVCTSNLSVLMNATQVMWKKTHYRSWTSYKQTLCVMASMLSYIDNVRRTSQISGKFSFVTLVFAYFFSFFFFFALCDNNFVWSVFFPPSLLHCWISYILILWMCYQYFIQNFVITPNS